MSAKSISLNKITKLYLDYLKTTKCNATYISYYNDLNLFINFLKEYYPTTKNFNDLKANQLEHYQRHLLDILGYKLSTAHRKFVSLRTFFNYAEADYIHLINPSLARFIKNDKFGIEKKNKPVSSTSYISTNTIKEILNRLKNSSDTNVSRDICIFKFLLYFGFRRSDILKLKWQNINFHESELKIQRQKNSRINTLALPTDLVKSLISLKQLQLANNLSSQYVFIAKNINKSLSNTGYTHILNKYTAGLTDEANNKITGHTFKHTYITLSLKKGISIQTLSFITGTSLDVLQEFYNHNIAISLAEMPTFFTDGTLYINA